MYRNIDKQKKLMLKNLVEYQDGQVVSKTLVQNDLVSMTVFSFDKGEEISSHSAGGDAMVTVLEGVGRFTVGGEVFILEEGETLIMPKGIPHAVFGEEKFKMQLTVSFCTAEWKSDVRKIVFVIFSIIIDCFIIMLYNIYAINFIQEASLCR